MTTRLWTSGLVAALAGHGLVMAMLILGKTLAPPPEAANAAILLELPPLPAPLAPEPAMEPPQEPKPQVKPKPKVVRKAVAATPLTVPVPASSPERPSTEPAAEASPPPPSAAAAANPVPAPVRPAPDPRALPSWQSRLLAHLERNKRYPESARLRGLRGVVVVAFAMDRHGMVTGRSVKNSAGHDILDRAALEMLERAQPLPSPPPEIEGDPIHLVVPVRFFLQ